jgi:hypothetical protein
VTEIQPPFTLQGGTVNHPAALFRRAIGGMLYTEGIAAFNNASAQGLPDDLKVGPDSPAAMRVIVSRGGAYIQGDDVTDQGMYVVYNDANVSLTVPAADATNPRIDNVLAHVKDNFHGQAGDTWVLEYQTGTPAGSPVAPTVPASAYRLATVAVAALASSIVAGNITNTRNLATIGLRQQLVAVRAYRSSTQNVPDSTDVQVNFNAETTDTDAFHDISSNTDRFTIPAGYNGTYDATAQTSWDASATGYRDYRITVNGVIVAENSVPGHGTRPQRGQVTMAAYPLVAGDIVRSEVRQNSGGAFTIQSGSGDTWFAMRRVGN